MDSTLLKEEQQSADSEKQVVTSENLSGADNAPTPIHDTQQDGASRKATKEADKEVTGSWQVLSQAQSAPISMVYHESNSPSSPRGDLLLNDIKGPPPDYESLQRVGSASPGAGATSPEVVGYVDPESANDVLPPRPEDKSAVGQLLRWVPRMSPATRPSASLSQPIIIPQLDVPPQRESVPFQRCYSDALAAQGVTMHDFVRFLDGLEIAQLPGSALQGLRMFGVGVAQLPVPILGTLTGKGISALGASGSGHNGSRARLYLEQARERYFKPRGLRLAVVADDELGPRLQVPAYTPHLGVLTAHTLSLPCAQRRLEALQPYTAPLRFDVPEPDKQISGVQKLARKHLRSRLEEKAGRLHKLRKRQWEGTTSELGAFDAAYGAKMSEIRRVQSELIWAAAQPGGHEEGSQFARTQETLRVLQHELQLLISTRQGQFRSDLALSAEMDEVKYTRRLKWLVIENV